ncbi:hypothetical protein [Anaeroselena agilis]|uniref:Uncharacterized protein n=1 Tax=Anaeroselena agilis TaxID=3063788 RepID=A0ABU3NU51_9FIRM|nr:hypothetical protein [Selenomonadales bacterium 4137-cl]
MKELDELRECLDQLEEGYCSLARDKVDCFIADAALINTRARLEDVLTRIETIVRMAQNLDA